MTKFRNIHSKALLSDEWFTALVASMKNAANKTRAPQPATLTRNVQNQKGTPLGKLVLAAAGPLRADRPGNGGMRLWQYSSMEKADAEALNLAIGMEVKHTTFNTGFTGAKLVCAAASPVSEWSSGDKQQLLDTAASMLTDLDGAMWTSDYAQTGVLAGRKSETEADDFSNSINSSKKAVVSLSDDKRHKSNSRIGRSGRADE